MSFLSALKAMFTPKYGSVTAHELKDWMKERKKVEIIDVRSKGEFSEGTIKGFKHYDMFGSSFKTRIEKLDKSKTYVVYCRTGSRSRSACSMMTNLGFDNVYNLRGGIMGWNAAN